MNLESKVMDWFANGQVGESSKCMALHLTGHWASSKFPVYPHDPDDFNRCHLLLKAVPELRERLPQMAEVNEYWAALVARWGEIEKSLVDEIGENGEKGYRAPLTYDLMWSIFEPVGKRNRGQ